MEFRRRHDLLRIVGDDVPEDGARIGISGNNRSFFGVLELRVSPLRRVETETRFALFGIESMTGKAGVRKDRTNVGVEGDGFRSGGVGQDCSGFPITPGVKNNR